MLVTVFTVTMLALSVIMLVMLMMVVMMVMNRFVAVVLVLNAGGHISLVPGCHVEPVLLLQ